MAGLSAAQRNRWRDKSAASSVRLAVANKNERKDKKKSTRAVPSFLCVVHRTLQAHNQLGASDPYLYTSLASSPSALNPLSETPREP